jgi:hypothetical protein
VQIGVQQEIWKLARDGPLLAHHSAIMASASDHHYLENAHDRSAVPRAFWDWLSELDVLENNPGFPRLFRTEREFP